MPEVFGPAGVRVGVAHPDMVNQVADLWGKAGLVRPWNDPAHDFHNALSTESATVLCATADAPEVSDSAQAHVVGAVLVGHDSHRGWIYYLAVRDDSQRTGLGALLVRQAEGWLRDRGIAKLMLMIRTENAAVENFYQQLGYTEQRVKTLGRFLD